MNCVGLFGTCGNSKWRDKFVDIFSSNGIEYFNPMVENWKPEDASIEAKHLAFDNIILFPITKETYGVGSLSEVGFGVLNAIKLDDRRDFVVLIDQELDNKLIPHTNWKLLEVGSVEHKLQEALFERSKESLRARALVLEHLKKQNLQNVYLVENFDEMLEVAITLYNSNKAKYNIEKFSMKNKNNK
jgi:hypothetical protein